MQGDFINKLNNVQIYRSKDERMDDADAFVNKLLVEHFFSSQTTDPYMMDRYKEYRKLVDEKRGKQELSFYDKMHIVTILRDVKRKN